MLFWGRIVAHCVFNAIHYGLLCHRRGADKERQPVATGLQHVGPHLIVVAVVEDVHLVVDTYENPAWIGESASRSRCL